MEGQFLPSWRLLEKLPPLMIVKIDGVLFLLVKFLMIQRQLDQTKGIRIQIRRLGLISQVRLKLTRKWNETD